MRYYIHISIVHIILIIGFGLVCFTNISYASQGVWQEYSFSGMQWSESAYMTETACPNGFTNGGGEGVACNTARDTTCVTKPAISAQCSQGYGTCYAPYAYVCIASCAGVVPNNATSYDSEEQRAVMAGTLWTHGVYDTTQKCQFRCDTGYTWDGTACISEVTACGSGQTLSVAHYEYGMIDAYNNYVYCGTGSSDRAPHPCTVAIPQYVCSPSTLQCELSIPSHATAYSGAESVGLTTAEPWAYTPQNTARKCEFACDNGYAWNGSSCVPRGCSFDGELSWGGGQCTTSTNQSFAHNEIISFDNTAQGHVGSISYQCVFGRLIQMPGETCVPDFVPPTDGVCGTTSNLCVEGSFQDVVDSPTHTRWQCRGVNGGVNDFCAMQLESTCTVGSPCESAPNACGNTGNGTYDSSCVCSATPPAVPPLGCQRGGGGSGPETCAQETSSHQQSCASPEARAYGASPDHVDGMFTEVFMTNSCTGETSGHSGFINTCTIPTPLQSPEVVITPRVVKAGDEITITARSNGHVGCVLAGGNLTPQGVGRTAPSDHDPVTPLVIKIPVYAKTAYTLTCLDPASVHKYTTIPLFPHIHSASIEVITRVFES